MDQTDACAVVAAMHSDLLGSDARPGMLDLLAAELVSHGDCSRVLHQLIFSEDHLNRSANDAYRLVFRRAPRRDETSACIASIQSGKAWLSDLALVLLERVARDRRQTTASLLALLYDVAHGRELTVAELDHWVEWTNRHNRLSLPRAIWNGPEAIRYRITQAYRTHLWRDPDPSGIKQWWPVLAEHGDEPVRAALVSSLEHLILARARADTRRAEPGRRADVPTIATHLV